jgi:hypothetical protein
LTVPDNNDFNGQYFSVIAGGNALFGSAETSTIFTVGLYYTNVTTSAQNGSGSSPNCTKV